MNQGQGNTREQIPFDEFSGSLRNYLQATLGLDLSPNVSIPKAFLRTVYSFGGKPALLSKVDGKYTSITYQTMLNKVRYFAASLIANQIGVNGKVALFAKNCPEWAISDFGTMFAGCVTVPIYETLTNDSIEYIFKESEVSVVLVDSKQKYERIAALKEKLPDLKKIIVVDSLTIPTDTDEDVVAYEDWIDKGKIFYDENTAVIENAYNQIHRDDIASIVYTSGTTGLPKGVMLTHKNFLSQVYAILSIFDITQDDRLLSILPLCHAFERATGHFTALMAGSAIYYAEDMTKVADNLIEVKPHICIAVPRLFEKIYAGVQEGLQEASFIQKIIFKWALNVGSKLYQVKKDVSEFPSQRRLRHRPETSSKDWQVESSLWMKVQGYVAKKLIFNKITSRLGGNIRYFVSGGAPLSEEIIVFFRNLGVVIYEGYGLTETSPVIAFNYRSEYEPGTVGKLLPFVDVRLSKDKEILVRGPNVMKGYYKNEEATREVLDEDGWFHTGDMGAFTDNNNLAITGRIKEVIVTSGGKNIPIAPIETKLNESNLVSQGMLVGNKRNYLSALIFPDLEKMKSLAEKIGSSSKTIEEMCNDKSIIEAYQDLVDKINSKLARFETIKRFKLIPHELTVDEGELTPTLKLRRNVVETKFQNEIDSIYEQVYNKPASN